MKIYLASSWRNPQQPDCLAALRRGLAGGADGGCGVSGPTREESERAAEILKVHRDLTEMIPGDYPVCTRRMIVEALDFAIAALSWSCPALDGERVELAAEVLVAADWMEESYRRAADALDPVARERGAELCAHLRRAAILLLRPVAGVSKAEVLALIERYARRHPNWEALHAAVNVLPEAEPEPGLTREAAGRLAELALWLDAEARVAEVTRTVAWIDSPEVIEDRIVHLRRAAALLLQAKAGVLGAAEPEASR